jgi:LAO/AO transport system kinase
MTPASDDLAQRVLAAEHRAIAQSITMVESGDPSAADLHARLFPSTGRAFTIGITGPPGAGKSTLVDHLAAGFRAEGLSVGVLAVDPSSPFTRGALLGDRVRMRSFATDPGVFVRSMANRGHVGGIAMATPSAVRVLDAAGFDRIIVETVGVGQSEIDIVGAVDCTVVVEVPGMGDVIQTMKAGLMEIADRFVINKADREGAQRIARELRRMLHERGVDMQEGEVLMTVANRGEGITELIAAMEGFLERQQASGALEHRRLDNLSREVVNFVGEQARQRLVGTLDQGLPGPVIAALRGRSRDPESLATEIVDRGLNEPSGATSVGTGVPQ